MYTIYTHVYIDVCIYIYVMIATIACYITKYRPPPSVGASVEP